MKKNLEKNLEQVEALSNTSKLGRLLHNPIRYIYAIVLKNVLYPIFQKEISVSCELFTGKKINVVLPASTDIYLTGGKSHPSEIRLAKFLIHNLQNNDSFWDIGAHYGYFSILASELVGPGGKVVSIEASTSTFDILKKNTEQYANISIRHNAMSDNNQKVSFFELPNLYSEYNTTDLAQFENEKWFSKIKTKKVVVDALTLDNLLTKYGEVPNIIKIDVEGGEFAVINGGMNLLKKEGSKPVIVMEYLEAKRNNQPHKQATDTLTQLGFKPNIIQNDGSLIFISDIEAHLSKNNLESDNIVFKK
ncbi:MAG: FkbM family methyltransferase [Bacteroidia bacterium]|nr:FkbM family methyltransferase [Bacteroidia bacterium]